MNELWEDTGEADGEADDEGPVFASLDEFVTDHLAQLIRRRINGTTLTWCPAWWKHAEAISRLDAVWRAWEHLRLDENLGMSTWWLYHCDPHLNALLDADTGPFSACSPTDGHTAYPHPPLPLDPSDPAMWTGTAFSARENNGDR
ncbi:DUF4913 domain-containing protein [Streptomyces brevispora]|uniref:DUF4913 domain-containing protein n=1 Tax=Streptomyces brevispora TaxID=887462 RepID=UPI002E34F56A|nr:DUF4913 domain-containing protein [Streptomyces brevispora]